MSELLSFAEKTESQPVEPYNSPWKVLVVDDDKMVHAVTKIVLKNFSYNKRGVEFMCACTYDDAVGLLEANSDIAVVLLDIVMGPEISGLSIIDYIRKEMHNEDIRIIVRTGQPGNAPEEKLINEYAINDYREKTELTEKKLTTALIMAIRDYEDIKRVRQEKSFLEQQFNLALSMLAVNTKQEVLEILFNGIKSLSDWKHKNAFFSQDMFLTYKSDSDYFLAVLQTTENEKLQFFCGIDYEKDYINYGHIMEFTGAGNGVFRVGIKNFKEVNHARHPAFSYGYNFNLFCQAAETLLKRLPD